MARDNRLGEPVTMTNVLEFTKHEDDAPGFGWEVSEDAKADIDEMEANARSAEHHSGALILRAPK